MNANTRNILILIVVSILFFFLGRCTKECEVKDITVTTPEISGGSDTITVFQPIITEKDKYIFKTDTIETESKFNQELADKYVNLQKQYTGIELEKERLKEYLKSISERVYQVPFEDDKVKITNNIKTQGELLSFQQDYTIKPIDIKVPVPIEKKKINLFLGGGVINTKEFDNFKAEANAGLQLRNGNIIQAGYNTGKEISLTMLVKL